MERSSAESRVGVSTEYHASPVASPIDGVPAIRFRNGHATASVSHMVNLSRVPPACLSSSPDLTMRVGSCSAVLVLLALLTVCSSH